MKKMEKEKLRNGLKKEKNRWLPIWIELACNDSPLPNYTTMTLIELIKRIINDTSN